MGTMGTVNNNLIFKNSNLLTVPSFLHIFFINSNTIYDYILKGEIYNGFIR